MLKITSITTLLLVLNSTALFAATTETETKNKEAINKTEKSKTLNKYERVVLDESMLNREDKSYSINATLFGSSFGASTTSLEIGKHLKTNTILSIQFSSLSNENLEDLDENDKEYHFNEARERDGYGKYVSVGIKQFTSNSFYYKPEIYARSQELVHDKKVLIGDKYYHDTEEKGTIEDVGISFKIGNQWQWENFTLGCDWIGLTRTLAMTKKTGKVYSNNKNSATAMNFYIGYSF